MPYMLFSRFLNDTRVLISILVLILMNILTRRLTMENICTLSIYIPIYNSKLKNLLDYNSCTLINTPTLSLIGDQVKTLTWQFICMLSVSIYEYKNSYRLIALHNTLTI